MTDRILLFACLLCIVLIQSDAGTATAGKSAPSQDGTWRGTDTGAIRTVEFVVRADAVRKLTLDYRFEVPCVNKTASGERRSTFELEETLTFDPLAIPFNTMRFQLKRSMKLIGGRFSRYELSVTGTLQGSDSARGNVRVEFPMSAGCQPASAQWVAARVK